MSDEIPPKKKRGFAAINPELLKSIAKKGGQAAHAQGTAHEFTSEEARAAGRKGGFKSHANRRARGAAEEFKPKPEFTPETPTLADVVELDGQE